MVFFEVISPSPSDQPLAGRFVVSQFHNHAQRVSSKLDLSVLGSVAFVFCGANNALIQRNFRPLCRHNFIKPGAREHQQLDQTREAKMNPAKFFQSPQLDQQPVDFIWRRITPPRFLKVVLYAFAGVLMVAGQPAPALGQAKGFRQCFKAAISGNRLLMCCVPLPKGRLVNVDQSQPGKGSPQQMQPKIRVVIFPAPLSLSGFRPTFQEGEVQISQRVRCFSLPLQGGGVTPGSHDGPVTFRNLARFGERQVGNVAQL